MNVVDDQYWLEYSKKIIENSVTTINDAAAKLEKMTLWFWGLYTASFTIGVSINIISAPKSVLILLASPIVSLILTYWLCGWVQLPVISEFSPQIPEEIENSFNRAARIKNRRLKIALFSTFLSAILLSIALFSLSFVNKKEKSQIDFSYEKDLNKIIVSGLFPKSTIIHIEADSSQSKFPHHVIFFKTDLKILDNELINCNIPVSDNPSSINIILSWKEEDSRMFSISKKIDCKK